MTVTLLTSLFVQVVTLALIWHRVGRGWLRRPVTLLVICSVLNQGAGPVLLAIPSIGVHDNFAQGISQQYIDEANLIMSAAMLAFTAGTAATSVPLRVPLAARAMAAIALDLPIASTIL